MIRLSLFFLRRIKQNITKIQGKKFRVGDIGGTSISSGLFGTLFQSPKWMLQVYLLKRKLLHPAEERSWALN